jgi:hypothetical protein
MAFNKPSTGDPVAATDINQIIESLDGSAATGEPIKHTKVNDAANYALDVQNLDLVKGYGLRVRDPQGSDVLKTDKDQIEIGKNVVAGDGVLMDGVDVGAHTHTGTAGHGPQIPEGGIANGAVTADKIGAGAVTAGKLGTAAVDTAQIALGAVAEVNNRANAITETKIANGAVTAAKLSFDPATQAELDAHAGTSAEIHGLAAGVSVLGSKQGAGRRIEVKSATYEVLSGGDQGTAVMTVTWDNAFITAVYGIASARSVANWSRSTYPYALTYSVTGATQIVRFETGGGATTIIEFFMALGV